MRILALGDVVGRVTLPYLKRTLWEMRKKEKIDFVIANGENTSEIHGICAGDARELSDTGVDLITLGNHAFGARDIAPYLDAHDREIIRPANYPASAPGSGYTIANAVGRRVLCANICGVALMEPLANPFDTVDAILKREAGNYDLSVMDIHAEATSEKLALARYFDGRVDVMFGTHTHVPTADECVLPHGSLYITDLGMSGPAGGIIGTDAEAVIARFRTHLPVRFTVAEGKIRVMGAIFDTDRKTVCRICF